MEDALLSGILGSSRTSHGRDGHVTIGILKPAAKQFVE
jgi:hypothetical protein